MPAQLIDGQKIAYKIKIDILKTIQKKCAEEDRRPPGLAVILIGDDPASHLYVSHKKQGCQQVGIQSYCYYFPATLSEEELSQLIQQLNDDNRIDGILLQLPLPLHLEPEKILEQIHPKKDIDGLHPYQLGRLAQYRPIFRPCTSYGVMWLLNEIQQIYKGKHAVIIGTSNIVGKPMAFELLAVGATVTLCHQFTHRLADYVKQADILISAAGQPHLIQGDWIKPNATVIDIGITRLTNGKLIGDIDFAKACKKAAWITPVPGGVGPMTVAMLLRNTLIAAGFY